GHLLFQSLNVNDYVGKKEMLSKLIAIKDIVRLDHKYYAVSASGLAGLYQYDQQNTKQSIWDKHYDKQISHNIEAGPFHAIIPSVRAKSVVYLKNKQTIYYATNNGMFKVTPTDITEIKSGGKTLFINK